MINTDISGIANGLSVSRTTSSSEFLDKYVQASEFLSQFDSENLTAEDATQIVSAFKELGLEPGRELESFLSDNGFDAKNIGELAGVGPQGGAAGGPPPPPPPSAGGGGINQDNLSLLHTILENYGDIESLEDSEKSQLFSQLEKAGLLEPGALIQTQS